MTTANKPINGRIIERAKWSILGVGALIMTNEFRSFEWSEVVRAGEYVTYGIKGARSLVELADGTILQVAATKLAKVDRAKLQELKKGAAVSSRCPDSTAQAVKWSE